MTSEEIRSNIKWWESKRWIYNVLVGISGVVALMEVLPKSQYEWTSADTLGIIFWGIGANVLYTLGTIVELFDWYYLKNKLGIKRLRLFFFISGTIVSCVYTYTSVLAYFLWSVW